MRLRATRLSLGGATDCLNWSELLNNYIVLVNLEPPQGSVDVGRFLCGLLWLQITQAVRRRPNGAPACAIVLEEWPAFLGAGSSGMADQCEDLLRLARSKGAYLYLLAQDLISIGKTSPTLPQVVRTNVHLHTIFRTTDDWSFALPVTGRRIREGAPPWEERRGRTYLERSAEVALLRDELACLPDRTCYLLDRRTGLPAVLLRTADLALQANDSAVAALEERAAQGRAVLPVADLERGEADVRTRLAALLGRGQPGPGPVNAGAAPPRRRGPRPMDVG